MRFYSLAVMSIAAFVLNNKAYALDSQAEAEAAADTKADSQTQAMVMIGDTSVSAQAAKSMPVLRNPMLTKASLNSSEVLVCTTSGCYAVYADQIDLSKVFLASATNGQSVLVPYNNHVEPGQTSGAIQKGQQLEVSEYVNRLITFEETEGIYDQTTYEMRIKAEADIMVALEAIKTDIAIVQGKFVKLLVFISQQIELVESRYIQTGKEQEIMRDSSHSVTARKVKTDRLFDSCSNSEKSNYDHRRVLILYCQQFAFASVMQSSCSDLLWCRGRQIQYGYLPFEGQIKEPIPVFDNTNYQVETGYDSVAYPEFEETADPESPSSVTICSNCWKVVKDGDERTNPWA